MIALPAGRFLMGSDEHYPEERPVHEARVAAFLMDEHPVTNAEFRRFVKDTSYRTSAEVAPRAEDFPDADPADLVAGSLVFRATAGPVPRQGARAARRRARATPTAPVRPARPTRRPRRG